MKWKCLRYKRGHSFLLWCAAFGRASVISKKGMHRVFLCPYIEKISNGHTLTNACCNFATEIKQAIRRAVYNKGVTEKPISE